jgi:DNA-directed RNA polymerase alpha subunit
MNTENQMTKEEKEAIALLNTPIENLGFEVRASRVLCEQGIQTLRDLLELTYKYGWNRLTKIRDLGSTTQNRIMKRLQELNILDDTDEDVSYLYKYLDK